jgi:hypothetical protein
MKATFVKSHGWLWTFLLLTIFFVVGYVALVIFDEVTPGNFWGLTFGTVATILFVAVGLYGIRRRTINKSSKLKLGSANVWLQVHLYGGTLFLLLMFLHTGLALPQGAFNWWLWLLSVWVVLSGLVGVGLQKIIPPLLTSALTTEIRADRIDELVNELRAKAETEAANSPTAIRDYYERTIAAEMVQPIWRPTFFKDITGGIQAKIREMEYLKQFLSETDQKKLDNLALIYRTKLECDAHYTLQKPLRLWLVAHLPVSMALCAFVLIHLFIVFYY